ncbi:MAG: hypothetical protein JKX93_18925 [Rhizobiaceae bacterium]|nr:hypothetical protein [Rhizobiaceae bacterium]
MFFSLSQPSFAQTMSFGDAVAGWAQACGGDVGKFCKGVRPGSNQMVSCLAGKGSQICKKATVAFKVNMDARFAAQAAAPKLCGNDAKRLCSGVKSGRARLLRCIMRKENFRAASRPCKNALQSAGWLDNISKKVN